MRLVNCKKLRKVLTGSLQRAAGCLLALIIFLIPCFNVYAAMSFTDESYPVYLDDVPDTSSLVSQALFLNYSFMLFYNANQDKYLFTSFLSNYNPNSNDSFEFIYCNETPFGNQVISRSNEFYYYVQFRGGEVHYGNRDYFIFEYDDTLGDWLSVNAYSRGSQSIAEYCEFYDYTGCSLLAYYMQPSVTNSQGQEVFRFRNWAWNTSNNAWSNNELYTVNTILPSTKFSFDLSTGLLSGVPTPEPEPEYNGLLGSILQWLSDIWDGITNLPTSFVNAISNIQGWLSTLGTNIVNGLSTVINNIQGWLSTLGTNIVNGLSTVINNIQGWLSNLGSSIGGFFSTIWSNIQSAWTNFTDFINTYIVTPVVNWITDFFEDLKALFVPTSSQLEEMRQENDTFLTNRLGFVYQSYNFIMVLFGNDTERRVSHIYPRIDNYSSRVRGSQRRSSRSVEVVYTIKDLFDFSLADDVTLIIPRLRVRVKVGSGRVQYYEILGQQSVSINDTISQVTFNRDYSGDSVIDFWDFWFTCVNAILVFSLIVNGYEGLCEILGISNNLVDIESDIYNQVQYYTGRRRRK